MSALSVATALRTNVPLLEIPTPTELFVRVTVWLLIVSTSDFIPEASLATGCHWTPFNVLTNTEVAPDGTDTPGMDMTTVGGVVSLGGGVVVTVTVTDWLALPPAPVQVSVKVAVLVRGFVA